MSAESKPSRAWRYRLRTEWTRVASCFDTLDAFEAKALAREFTKRKQEFECVRVVRTDDGRTRFVPCPVPDPKRRQS